MKVSNLNGQVGRVDNLGRVFNLNGQVGSVENGPSMYQGGAALLLLLSPDRLRLTGKYSPAELADHHA
jgi:hypothetical protein